MAKEYKSLAEVEFAIQVFVDNEMDIPEHLLILREKFKKSLKGDEYIYNTLKNHSKFPVTEEKDVCVRTTVVKLMEEGENATEPVLLLGKIQCGKTDTFVNIMGLSFDKGIDVCIVFTKGTKALAQQTMERMAKDFRHFEDTGDLNQKATVHIYDIIKDFTKDGLPESTFNRKGTKVIIVCKKQADNMKHLINLFTKKSPYLKQMKVLVVDDEADFCSRNYVKKGDELDLAIISKQIVEFTKIPEFCRYLQVTATPYSLYLQPDGNIMLNENGDAVPTFKPRYTALVPVHKAYVGGKQYFEDSTKEESMFSHLYQPVAPKCIQVMGKRDKRYEKSGIASQNIRSLTNGLVAYIMAGAIRSLQEEKVSKAYKSSALIHVDVDKDSHSWQEVLVKRIVEQIGVEILQPTVTDGRVTEYIETLYADYEEANRKGREAGLEVPELPTEREVTNRIRRIFADKEISIQIVNSDNDVQSKLDKDGQLKLHSVCNIFIGGSILDRGITINNMLCFFYGRDPKDFQMDTVLQHCRMYGSRSMADMAVTKFHTTDNIYKAFKTMNQLDNQLRISFVKRSNYGDDAIDSNTVFVRCGKHIKPCASGKIRPSNVININPKARILPIGFQTGPKTAIEKTINKIQTMIESSPYYNNKDKDGIFDIPVTLVREIIPLIRSTYIYGPELNCQNEGLDWDETEMLGVLQYAVEQTDCETIHCMHRLDKDMSRWRSDMRFIDAPDDGHKDLSPARQKAIDRPLIMFIKENGKKEKGWRDTPFYWPVLVLQQNIDTAVFTSGTKVEEEKEIVDAKELLEGINPDEVLRLTLQKRYLWEFLSGEKTFETREINETTASKYLERDYSTVSGYMLAEGVAPSNVSNVNSANGNQFPFVFRPYKYILFRTSRDKTGSLLLVKIDEENPVDVFYEPMTDEDVLIDRELNETEYTNDHRLVKWVFNYNCSTLKFKLNRNDQSLYDEMKENTIE